MQLEFTSEQEDLRDSVRVVLERECPMTLVRAVVGTGVAPDALWKHMVELGWTALTVPEAAGGLGLGPVELAVVVDRGWRELPIEANHVSERVTTTSREVVKVHVKEIDGDDGAEVVVMETK